MIEFIHVLFAFILISLVVLEIRLNGLLKKIEELEDRFDSHIWRDN